MEQRGTMIPKSYNHNVDLFMTRRHDCTCTLRVGLQQR